MVTELIPTKLEFRGLSDEDEDEITIASPDIDEEDDDGDDDDDLQDGGNADAPDDAEPLEQ
jgi:hypothetical protein